MKTLVVHGTRHEGTCQVSEEIAKSLREEGFNVKVVNPREERLEHISEHELIIVGSELQDGKWVDEVDDFIKRFKGELAKKKVVFFVSSAYTPVYEIQGKTAEVEKARQEYLEEKAENYSLKPIEMKLFGGVLDFNKMGFLMRKRLGWMQPSLEAAGFKTSKPGVYDTRNWNEIREWVRKLVLKARYL